MDTITVDTKDPRNKGILHYAKIWTKVYSGVGGKNYLQDALEDEWNVRVQNPAYSDEHYGKILALQNLIKQS